MMPGLAERGEGFMLILRFADAPEFELSGARVRGLASASRRTTETTITVLIRPDGKRALPAWAE